jgi:outer membrane receptor protein involved in Fe transport
MRDVYVVLAVAALAAARPALGQSFGGISGLAGDVPAVSAVPTTGPASVPVSGPASRPATGPATTGPSTAGPAELKKIVVTSDLDVAREQIAPALGAGSYTIGQEQIETIPGGSNASFQQVLLRAPGVVMDSYGQEHVRGEHGNLTYRINGVLLPQPLNGFGQEIDTRLIDSMTLIDGSLPAQFGFHTAGIADIQTRTGAALNGGEISIYGGSFGTFQSSASGGGSFGPWDVFVTATQKTNEIGIENPTDSLRPVHDGTDQYKGFAYLSYHIDDTSRVTFMVNGSDADFQIPNTPGLAPTYTLTGGQTVPSADLNETQNEKEYYGVVSYQKTTDAASLQLSGFTRYGSIHFEPDPIGDLIYQGLAGDVQNTVVTNGVQFDGSYIVDRRHTVRAGFIADYTLERQVTDSAVFADTATLGTPATPFDIQDDTKNYGYESGIYLQDEWKLTDAITLNYGARYDRFDSNFDTEQQLSPRVNMVLKFDEKTTGHVGYSRYFSPPPVQNVGSSTLAKFGGTTNAAAVQESDPPKVERANYFDVGVSHEIVKPWSVSLDGFYKRARNLVDLGQFGSAVILAPYNYRKGDVYGAEASTAYKLGPVSAFGNLAFVQTRATDINSQQFEFDPAELGYIQGNYVHLDHESEWTASAGASYQITRHDMVYVDVLYGSGLRAGFANVDVEPSYYPVNIGYQHVIELGSSGQTLKFRFDVTNVFDDRYQIRDGNGIGTSAAQYGQPRGFFGGLTYTF